MSKLLKITLAVFTFGIIAAVLGYVFIYNKPHRNFEKADADFILEGKELYRQFKNSSQQAAMRYNGKVVEITGLLNRIETPDSLTVAVFVFDEGMFGDEGIRCTMLPNYAADMRRYEGDTVTMKGYCTGYNESDVIMESCSVINKIGN